MDTGQKSFAHKPYEPVVPNYDLPDFSLIPVPQLVYPDKFLKKILEDDVKHLPNEIPFDGQLSGVIEILKNPKDSLDYRNIFYQFNKTIKEYTTLGSFNVSEIGSIIHFIRILNSNIDSIPTNDLSVLITGLLQLLELVERQVPCVPSLSRISKPLQIIPRLTNQRRRSSPRPLPNVRTSQPISKSSPLCNFEPLIQLISFFIARATINLSETTDGCMDSIKLELNIFLLKMLGSSIATLSRATAAAALCKLSINSDFRNLLLNDPDSQPTIVGSLISDEEDDRTPDFAQLNVYVLSLIDILTLEPAFPEKYDISSISKDCLRAARIFPMYKSIILCTFYFLNQYSNDSIIRGSLIEEFGVEIIVALFIQLITVYKTNTLLAPLLCSVLTTFFIKEFDVASTIAVISDPVSITAIADIVPEISDPLIAAAIVRLIAVLATDASCASVLAPKLNCLADDIKIFSEPKVLRFVVPAIHSLMLKASFMPPNICARICEWLSMQVDDSLILSIVTFCVDYFERSPNPNVRDVDVLLNMMTLIGDSNHEIAQGALETAVSLCEKGLAEKLADPRTESRLKKAILQSKSNDTLVQLIAQLISKVPKDLISNDLLETAELLEKTPCVKELIERIQSCL